MTKRAHKYEIVEAVRGSFVGARGRVSYDVPAGAASGKDLDPEVLALLLETGFAVHATTPDAEGPDAAEAPAPAESEDSA